MEVTSTIPETKITSPLTEAERKQLDAWFAAIGGPDWRYVTFYDGRQALVHKSYRHEEWID